MRYLLLAATGATLLAMPIAAADLNPRALVLREADMPAGFQFDELNSGFRSNKREADGDAFAIALFKRWGRVGGYEAIFEHRAARVESRVDVFRKSEGARMVLAWHQRNVGSAAVSQSRLRIGDESWLYRIALGGPFRLMIWRYKRVFATIVATGITKARVLALGRAQQRRIAAGLR